MFEIHRRRRRLSQSITSSKLAPERDTSWMRGSLMERKGCNRKEEIRGKKGNVTAPLMQCIETRPLGMVIYCQWPPKKKKKMKR